MEIVFLVGYMAVGKTTIAQFLAEKLSAACVDLDDYIEKKGGKSVADLINDGGEEAFRKTERKALTDVIDLFSGKRVDGRGRAKVVVALGGGTPCYADNMDVIRASGVVVWLRLSVGHLTERLTAERGSRPLLSGVQDCRLSCTIGRHLTIRSTYYERAHITVDIDGLSPDDAANLIIEKLKRILYNN